MPIRRYVKAIASAFLVLCAGGAAADGADAPYCRRVKARASEDATLLVWPKLVSEGVKFPSASGQSTNAIGPTVGSGLQPRIGLSFSLVDAARGRRLEAAANADCRAHEAAEEVQLYLSEAANAASLPAVVAQLSYLRGQRPRWEELLLQANQRRAAGLATVTEIEDLRRRAEVLDRRLAVAESERERLAQEPKPRLDAAALAAELTARSMEFERESARARMLEAFQVKVTGGVIPLREADWYALVEASVSLGVFARGRAQDELLAARRAELAESREEGVAKIAAVEKGLRAELARARRELAAVEQGLASVRSTAQLLARAETANGQQALATIRLDEMLGESDAVFLRALVASLADLTGDRA